jgi:hypothetical protein
LAENQYSGRAQGLSEKFSAARTYSDMIGLAAVLIVDNGIVVEAWVNITRKYQCHSMRKSLLSAMIGIHIEEGHKDLSKTLEELGIDDTEPSCTIKEFLMEYTDHSHRKTAPCSIPCENIQQGDGLFPCF